VPDSEQRTPPLNAQNDTCHSNPGLAVGAWHSTSKETDVTTNILKALLKVKEFIAAPGVFDMVSAKLALSSASPADAPGNGHRQHCNQRDENG
jgi:hypothetical protein